MNADGDPGDEQTKYNIKQNCRTGCVNGNWKHSPNSIGIDVGEGGGGREGDQELQRLFYSRPQREDCHLHPWQYFQIPNEVLNRVGIPPTSSLIANPFEALWTTYKPRAIMPVEQIESDYDAVDTGYIEHTRKGQARHADNRDTA